MAERRPNRYDRILEHVFAMRYVPGAQEVSFTREDFSSAAQELGVKLPSNISDILYSFRYRSQLPDSISRMAPAGKGWIIPSVGRSQYRFVARTLVAIRPNQLLAETKIPDATPAMVAMYALDDEQALLAKLRYNRLIDIFTGLTCYSLQSHLRTTVPNVGQIETDEIYIGIDRRGAQYVIPVQAKGGSDTLGIVQIEQDFALCAAKFPNLICQPISAQFIGNDLIALFAFEMTTTEARITTERHYRLVPKEGVTPADLQNYRVRPMDTQS